MGNSKNIIKIHGFMLDAARLMETMDYYHTFLDFCAQWKINSVVFRLTDDQGCALQFTSHPELLYQKNALTIDEMHELVQYAVERNIQLIPEIESLGHCSYITQIPEYSHLDDTRPDDPEWATGLPPLHKQVMAIFKDLYQETLEIFNSPYLHAGCTRSATNYK
jgi:hexosaminidase